MKATVEWINLGMMDTYLTMSLGHWEEKLKTPSRDSQHMTRKMEYPWIIDNMDTKPYPWQANMLDAGSGSTALGFYMSQGIIYGNSGHPVKMDMTHMDVDPEAIRWVEKNGGKAAHGSVLAIPFADQSFDLVVCVSVLEHLGYRDVGRAIRELIRVTRKRLLITMDVIVGVESQGYMPCKAQPN